MTNGKPNSNVRGGQRRKGPKPKPKPKPKAATTGTAATTAPSISGASNIRFLRSPSMPADLLDGRLGMDVEEITRAMMEQLRLEREANVDADALAKSTEAVAATMDRAAVAAEGSSTTASDANNDESTASPKDLSSASAQDETYWQCETVSAADISPDTFCTGTTTDPSTGLRRMAISGSEIIINRDHAMPIAYCPPDKVGLVISYARSIICNVIMVHHCTETATPPEPPQAFQDHVDQRMKDRACAIIEAHGPLSRRYADQAEVVASVHAFAALACAQEYVNASGRFFRAHLLEIASLSATKCWAAPASDKAWLLEFIGEWIDEHPYQLPAAVPEDGIKKDKRVFDLIEHFRKGNAWPRTLHGNRVMPFGAPDLLDKTRFEEGESKRACLSCCKEFGTARGWREHLLVSGEHEVYLCCGRQFVTLEEVLKHLAGAHAGKLGMLEPFIWAKNPSMELWE